MPQYLLNIIQPDGAPPEPEFLEPIMRDLQALDEEMQAAGAWVFSAGLHPPSTATVVRHRDGETLMTDGPFVEANEHIGGFTIIEAPDLDAALEWAGKMAKASTLPIEVRPVADQTDRGRRTCLPRGVRPRGGRPGPRLRRHRRRRGGGPGRVRRSGSALAARPGCRRARPAGSSRRRATAGSTASAARRRARRASSEAVALAAAGEPARAEEEGPVRDDRLRLIFTCCHPSLAHAPRRSRSRCGCWAGSRRPRSRARSSSRSRRWRSGSCAPRARSATRRSPTASRARPTCPRA